MQKSIFSLVLLMLSTSVLFAQKSLMIRGLVVSDTDQSELIGASILLNGTKNGASTDIDGTFKLNSNHPLPWEITIKYLGFLDHQFLVENTKDLHLIKMKEDPNTLDKVIICPLPVNRIKVCPLPKKKEHQSKIIRGRVIDKTNQTPLIASVVLLKGTNLNTVTDLDGYFEMEIPYSRDSHRLVFRYNGYEDHGIFLKHFTNGMDIEMETPRLKCKPIEGPVMIKNKKKRSFFKTKKRQEKKS